MEHTQIVVNYDDRERARLLLETLAGFSCIQLQKRRLPLGDYQINDWLIERKTLADLVVSLCDGRLFSQIYRLSQSSYNTALLIEGSSQDIIQYQVSREAILGALCSISINFQMPTLRSLSQQESAKMLYFCATQTMASTKQPKLGARKPKRRKKQQLFILQSLPNIGPHLAAKLLDHFETIEAIMTAQTEALTQVEGIGLQTADKIRTTLTKKA